MFRILTLMLILFIANPAMGWRGADEGYEIIKCTDKDGKISYGHHPCLPGHKKKKVVSVSAEEVRGEKARAEGIKQYRNMVDLRLERERNARLKAYKSSSQQMQLDSEVDLGMGSGYNYQQERKKRLFDDGGASLESPQQPSVTNHGGVSMPSPPQPSVITSCDGGGCWDNLGGRYNKGAGTTYFPSTGGACQMVGGMMQCP